MLQYTICNLDKLTNNKMDIELDDWTTNMNEYFEEHLKLYKQLTNKQNKSNKDNIFILFENNYLELHIGIRRDRHKKYHESYTICSTQYNEMKKTYSKNDYNIILDNAHNYRTEVLINEGINYQEKTICSLEKDLQMIADSKEIAKETIAELGRQEEQLLLIGNNVSELKSGLRMAVKRLRVIGRNLMKDWIVRMFCFLILGALITIVILFGILKKH